MSAITQNISAASLNRLALRLQHLALKTAEGSQKLYQQGRFLAQGPIRNNFLIAREFARSIVNERSIAPLTRPTVELAMQQYRMTWERIFPEGIRKANYKSLITQLGELTWRQVGEGALVVGEVLSLYYMSKLVFLTGKKTIRTVF